MSSNDRSDLSDFIDDFGDVSAGFASDVASEGLGLLTDPGAAVVSGGEDLFDGSSGDSGNSGITYDLLLDTGFVKPPPETIGGGQGQSPATPEPATPALTDTSPVSPATPEPAPPALTETSPASPGLFDRELGLAVPASSDAASDPVWTGTSFARPAVVESEPASGTAATGIWANVPTNPPSAEEMSDGPEPSLDDMGPGLQVPGGEHALSEAGAEHALTDTAPASPALTDTAPGSAVVASGTAVTASEPGLTDTAPRVEMPVGLERSLDDMGPSLQVPGAEHALSDAGAEHALSDESPGIAEHVGVSENREAPVIDDTQVPEPRVESSATDDSSGVGGRGEGPVVR